MLKNQFLILVSLFLGWGLQAQTTAARSFHLDYLQNNLDSLREKTIEQVIISGKNTPETDQKIIDTLRYLATGRITSTKNPQKFWKKFDRVFKHLTIVNANWDTLPNELAAFDHLFELVFINCPNLSLKSINDQIRKNPKSELAEKILGEIVSFTFSNLDMPPDMEFIGDQDSLPSLRDIRLFQVNGLDKHCPGFLSKLLQQYPQLQWLSIQDSKLTDNCVENILPGFEQMISISLRGNRLTKAPRIPKKLKSLDISYNLIHKMPTPSDSVCTVDLDFFLIDCNLMGTEQLKMVLDSALFKEIEAFSYACNCDHVSDYKQLSTIFDQNRIARFLTSANRYVNDFNPQAPDCWACDGFKDQYLSEILDDIVVSDQSTDAFYLARYFGSTNRVLLRKLEDPLSRAIVSEDFYSLLKIKNCEVIDRGPMLSGWKLNLLVADENTPKLTPFLMSIFVPENPAAMGIIERSGTN